MTLKTIAIPNQQFFILQNIAHETGQNLDDLVSEVIEQFIQQFKQRQRVALLRQGRALWANWTDLPNISLDYVIIEIENTPQNPQHIKLASGLLAEHLLSSPYLPDPSFEVQQWNEAWDKIEWEMKQLEQTDQEAEVSLNHYE